jgi:hypothetical protein
MMRNTINTAVRRTSTGIRHPIRVTTPRSVAGCAPQQQFQLNGSRIGGGVVLPFSSASTSARSFASTPKQGVFDGKVRVQTGFHICVCCYKL